MELGRDGISLKVFDKRKRLVGWVGISAAGLAAYPKFKRRARLNVTWEELFELVHRTTSR